MKALTNIIYYYNENPLKQAKGEFMFKEFSGEIINQEDLNYFDEKVNTWLRRKDIFVLDIRIVVIPSEEEENFIFKLVVVYLDEECEITQEIQKTYPRFPKYPYIKSIYNPESFTRGGELKIVSKEEDAIIEESFWQQLFGGSHHEFITTFCFSKTFFPIY